jgi:hypothetical protein
MALISSGELVLGNCAVHIFSIELHRTLIDSVSVLAARLNSDRELYISLSDCGPAHRLCLLKEYCYLRANSLSLATDEVLQDLDCFLRDIQVPSLSKLMDEYSWYWRR